MNVIKEEKVRKIVLVFILIAFVFTGLFLHYKDNPDIALMYYKLKLACYNCKDFLGLIVDERKIAATYYSIANAYYKKEDYGDGVMSNFIKAIEYYKKAIEIFERCGDYGKSGRVMFDLGDTYCQMEDYKDAKYFLEEGLKRVRKVGDKYWEATGYDYLGSCYTIIGDKKLAKEYYKKAYQIFKSIGAEEDANRVVFNSSILF